MSYLKSIIDFSARLLALNLPLSTLLQRRFFRAFSKPWRKDSVV
jgi:hypothetical protein